MKSKLLFFLLFVFNLGHGQSDQLSVSKINNIEKIINTFKENNIDIIASMVKYPLNREYPLPNINNREALKIRFNEVFDQELIERIAHSKVDQWSDVGWSGIMLDRGVLWIDSDGGQILAVNHQTDLERKLLEKLIAKDKESLAPSLRHFKSPVYKILTKRYLIRIDELNNSKYRYTSWKIGQNESSKPDLILNNGELVFEGSGGNHDIIFRNGNYEYEVSRNIIAEKGVAEISLVVKKNGVVILSQDGDLVIK
ncbi:hypothetical protein FNJ88_01410 [Chryseobacterium sp. SNU WT5]|nr:hypothetical protein FNJ88_01410 [Chryseobacterium sp. SNU WT5]